MLRLKERWKRRRDQGPRCHHCQPIWQDEKLRTPWPTIVHRVDKGNSRRVPASYAEALNQIAQETGKSQSELVREAVATYLGKTDPDSVARMARRLTKVERQIKRLLLDGE